MKKQAITYQKWYRKRGMWSIPHLKRPNIFDYNTIVLPLKSIYHWVDYKNLFDVAPDFTQTLINNTATKLFTEVTKDYPEENKGGFILLNKPVNTLLMKYYNSHPKIFKPQKNIHLYNEPGVLPVYSYGFIDNTHFYKKHRTSELKKWYNYYFTVFEKARNLSKESTKQQFIELEVPSKFPTRNNLLKCVDGIDEIMLPRVNHPDMWMVIEFWNLLGNTNTSYLFKNYETENFNTINILWRIDNKYICVNLGTLLGFAHGPKASMNPEMLQRHFLKLLINLRAVKDVGEETTVDSKEENNSSIKFNSDDDEEETVGYLDDDSDLEKTEIPSDISDINHDDTSLIKNTKLNDREHLINPEEDDFDFEDEFDSDASEDDLDEMLDTVAEDTSIDETIDVYTAYKPVEITARTVIENDTMKLVKAGVMSPASRQRLLDLTDNSFNLPSPIKNKNETIADSLVVNMEDIQINDKNELPVKSLDILDESMRYSSMPNMNEQYISKVLDKDILAMVMNLQKGGLVIKSYETEEVENINDHYTIHKVQVETIKGHVSTLTFKLPVIQKDGTFISSSSKRRIRTQRADIPIRKVSSNSVALTSYYSKMFVDRSERKQFNLEDYVASHVNTSSMENTNGIKDVKLNNVFDNTTTLPRQYTILSKTFSQITVNNNILHFSYADISKNFNNYLKSKNLIPLATDINGATTLYVSLKPENILHDANGKPLGITLFQHLGINENTMPLEYAEVNIFGKKIPLFLFLGHQLGFGSLLKTLKLNPRREAKGKRITLADGEYAFKFYDETLIFNRKTDPVYSTLIVNGLARYKNYIKQISVYDLDSKNAYSDMFDEIGAPIKLLKESKDMFNLWVDPITEKILKEMKEPTDLVLLFIRACVLLTNDEHPDAMDTLYMRDRGYERVAGILYSELTKVIKEYNSKPIYNNSKLTINPEAVWFNIITDQTQTLVEESNPIHNLKEKDVVVYSGAGGRSGQTMMANSRKFHPNSIGTTAENTVDSGDAGVIIYRSADPSYTSVYGISKKQDVKNIGHTRIFSNSMLLAPGANLNDAKRTNFISVQNSQTTFCDGYTPMPLRTGMEKTIHTKTGEMFSKIAEQNGKVINVTKNTMMVEYEDGTRVGFKIGRVVGKWAGDNIPHDLTTDYKKGDTFTKGDCLYYNSNYFVRDVTDGNNVMMKNFALSRVAIVENFDVYEDSCAMSKKFSSKLTSRLTHIRNIRISADQTIRNLVNIGDSVETDSMLCTIHSAQFGASVFGEDALKSLEAISALNPKAGNKGVIDDIKIIYVPEVEELSDEVRELVEEHDSRLYSRSKAMGSNIRTGKVNPGFLVDGVALKDDEIVFQVYITETADMSVADKIVISNQLKSTVGRYWNEDIVSEDGAEVDILFGAGSIDNRIVLDCELIGTTNTLLVALSDAVVKAYYN